MRRFVAVDAAHVKVALDYQLFFLTAIDANKEIVELCWGLSRVENEANWQWHLQLAALALPGLDSPATVIISDRQKVFSLFFFFLLAILASMNASLTPFESGAQ